jgi:hypothetical protein
MKTKVLTAVLLVGVTLQAAAMGHPHNLFAARKQIKAKRAAAAQTSRPSMLPTRVITYAKILFS